MTPIESMAAVGFVVCFAFLLAVWCYEGMMD
jgi:hypothetical protein